MMYLRTTSFSTNLERMGVTDCQLEVATRYRRRVVWRFVYCSDWAWDKRRLRSWSMRCQTTRRRYHNLLWRHCFLCSYQQHTPMTSAFTVALHHSSL